MNSKTPIVFLRRPTILTSVAAALGCWWHQLGRDLIALEIFMAPHQLLTDGQLEQLGDQIGVKFRIDDDEGGSSVKPVRPIAPRPPEPLEFREGVSVSPAASRETSPARQS